MTDRSVEPLSAEEETALRRDMNLNSNPITGGWPWYVARLLATLDTARASTGAGLDVELLAKALHNEQFLMCAYDEPNDKDLCPGPQAHINAARRVLDNRRVSDAPSAPPEPDPDEAEGSEE